MKESLTGLICQAFFYEITRIAFSDVINDYLYVDKKETARMKLHAGRGIL